MISPMSYRVLMLACLGLSSFSTALPLSATTGKAEKAEKKEADAPAFDLASVRGNPVVARIGDKKEITFKDVLQAMQALPQQLRQLPLDKLFAAARDQLIDLAILEQESDKEKDALLKDPEVKEAIEKATHQIVMEFYLRKATKNAATDDKIKERYEKLVAAFPKDEKEAQVRHILVKTEAEAQDIIKALKEGTDFIKLAREKSIDKKTAPEGGNLGYISILQKDELVAPFSEVVLGKDKQGNYLVATGSFYDKPVKTDFGYHVVKVDDRRPLKAPKFNEVKNFIKNQVSQEAIESHLKSLGGKTKIERLDPISGKPAKSLAEELQDMRKQASASSEKAKAETK